MSLPSVSFLKFDTCSLNRLFYISALSAVLKRATTIKRRGMDVVRQGQPGEEQYGDISSVGEWECAKAQTYGHRKSNNSRCTLSPAAIFLRLRVGTCYTGSIRPQFVSLSPPQRHPHDQNEYPEH